MSGKVVEAFDRAAAKVGVPPNADTQGKQEVHVDSKHDPSGANMAATCWKGKHTVKVQEVPKPAVTDPADAVLRVTSTCICGSDLHLYEHGMPGMKDGDVLGHEFMGIVESVGPNVHGVRAGDRVVTCFDIACGTCAYCKQALFTCCASTNTSKAQEAMYGSATAGLFGYSHLTGGWQGGQAEYVRVPFADMNLLSVPPELSDDQVVLLSDILPTAWHANELGEVGEGDNVAIWGAGPVGQLAAQCAHVRGARRIILIDSLPYRLQHAQRTMSYVDVVNFKETRPYEALRELVGGDGVDVGIDCVGQHYAHSLLHKAEMALQLETDQPECVNEMLQCVRKGGRLSIIGAYGGFVNHFNLGAFMEKHMTMRGGQTPVQRYWKDLLAMIQDGKLDATLVITHHMTLDEAAKGYQVFNDKEDGCIKVVLRTPAATHHSTGAATALEPAGVARSR